MKVKGFTLIELLAVIVILAIIALIAIPMISKIIDKTEDSAVLRSAELYIDGVNQSIMRANLADKIRPKECIIQEDGNLICDGEYEIKIEATGTKPITGTLVIEDRTVKSITDMILDGYEIDTDLKGKIIIKGKIDDYTTPSTGYLMNEPIQISINAKVLGGNLKKSQVESIEILNKNAVPGKAIEKWDVSENKDGSIMAWYVDEDGNGLYELYICGNVRVKANPNSSEVFSDYVNLKKIDLTYLDTSDVTEMNDMFEYCENLTDLNLSNFDTSKVTNMSAMFYNCEKLINLNIENFNTNEVTDMSYMFSDCEKLTTIIGLENFKSTKLTTTKNMFEECRSIETLNLSQFSIDHVKDMSSMFKYCVKLTTIIGIDKFNTSNVVNMEGLFASCESITSLNLSNFDTSNVTNMSGMFSGCEKLATLDLSSFNTSNVEDMSLMFDLCITITTINISNFITDKVTNMEWMFSGCYKIQTIDMRKATFTNVTEYSSMFTAYNTLTRVYVKDATARTFINSRLSDAGKTGVTVSIA